MYLTDSMKKETQIEAILESLNKKNSKKLQRKLVKAFNHQDRLRCKNQPTVSFLVKKINLWQYANLQPLH